MTRILRISLLVLVMALVSSFSVTTGKASPSLDVQIEDVAHNIAAGTGVFTATGPAVAAGAMCSSGSVEDLSTTVHGNSNGNYQILKVTKKFTCGDGSGTFGVKMVVRLDTVARETKAVWHITGGTGFYEGLRGQGKLVGTPVNPGATITDVYDGKIR